jgi:hypothetical protein
MTKKVMQQALGALQSLFSGAADDQRAAKCSAAIAALESAIAQQGDPVAQPVRKGLSDEQIIDIGNEEHRAMPAGCGGQDELLAIARAIERTLAEAWGVKLEGETK